MPGLENDEALKWVVVATVVVYAFSIRDLMMASGALAIGILDLQVVLLWAGFAGGLLGAVLNIIGGLICLLPLQFFPANKVDDEKMNKYRYMTIALWWTVFAWMVFLDYSLIFRLVIVLLSLLLVMILVYLGVKMRAFIAEHVIGSLVLPAQSTPKMDVMLPNGQRVKAKQAITQIRAAAFSTPDMELGQRHSGVGAWTNVKLPGNGSVRIDGAYWVHPAQAAHPPEEQRWILWFLGNGEVYEMMMPDFESLAKSSGMNVYLFNYRGVSHSQGELVQAWDLVDDGRVCIEYMTSSLAARPEYVILFGHSIGGAVAAQLRADHSPHGPLVVDRTFKDLGSAAHSVFGMLSKAIVGSELPIPKFVVVGLLSSVFKGSMDTLKAWRAVTGPRLALYHLEDAIIKYAGSSIHAALDKTGSIADNEAVKLGLDGEAGANNHHNLPLERFPEFQTIITKVRKMVGLTPIYGTPSQEHHMDSMVQQHNNRRTGSSSGR